MGNLSVAIVSVTLGVFLAGCTPRDVVLAVDGRKLTATERDEEVGLRIKLLRMANPGIGEAAAAMRRKTLADSAESHFIEETILLKVAKERNLTATQREIDDRMAGFTRFFDRLSVAERALAKSIAEREVLCEKAKQSIENEMDDKVSADELDQALDSLKSYAEMAAETNRLIYARATNVWLEVCGGRDFADAARQYSEADDRPSCEWGQFPLEAFAEEPSLKSALEGMRIGGVSYPVEGDNGLMIVRLKGIDKQAMPPRYDLERIFFRLPEEVPQMTVGEVAALISAKKRHDRLEGRLNDLRRMVRIVHH